MEDIRVELEQAGRTIELRPEHEPARVGEGIVSVRLYAAPDSKVTIDDEPLPVLWTEGKDAGRSTALTQVNLQSQVGYHRFTVRHGADTVSFDFATESAMASWESVRAMALFVIEQVFAYRRQFFYSTANGETGVVRSPQVEFAWFRERLEEIVRLVTSISANPGTQRRRTVETSFQGGRLAVPQTLRFLRENQRLLELSSTGLLTVEGKSYWPTAVKTVTSRREPAAAEHKQIAGFLRSLALNCETLLGGNYPGLPEADLHEWMRTLASLRQLRVIKRHDTPGISVQWSPVPTLLEKTDDRYGRLRELRAEYARDVSVSVSYRDAIRTNIRRAWEIYQTFVAHMVGYALGMQYCSLRAELRDRDRHGRSMISDRFELFYDTHPPPHVLKSWRDSSSRPARERPDVVVYDRKNRRVALVDAKFRREAHTEGVHADDLFELQGYFNSFGLQRGGIAFPSTPERTEYVEHDNILILGISVMAPADSERLCASIRDAVEALWQPAASQVST